MPIIINSAETNTNKAGIKQRALEELGVVQIGQGAESQHDSRINAAYNEVYSDLKAEGIATWSYSGYIPNEVTYHLVNLVAMNAINSFSVSNDRYQRIMAATGPDGERAKRQIRAAVTPDYESLENPSNF